MFHIRLVAAVLAAAYSCAPVAASAYDCANYAEGADRVRCQRRGPDWTKTPECEAYDSHVDRGWCKEDLAEASTKRTEALYESTLASARRSQAVSLPTEKDSFIGDLIRSQIAWRKFRDLECQTEAGAYGQGTGRLDVWPSCRQTLADQRLKQLEALKDTVEQ